MSLYNSWLDFMISGRTIHFISAGFTSILRFDENLLKSSFVRSSASWFSPLGTQARFSTESRVLNCSDSSIKRIVRGNFVDSNLFRTKEFLLLSVKPVTKIISASFLSQSGENTMKAMRVARSSKAAITQLVRLLRLLLA
jgi:hypothetical protein